MIGFDWNPDALTHLVQTIFVLVIQSCYIKCHFIHLQTQPFITVFRQQNFVCLCWIVVFFKLWSFQMWSKHYSNPSNLVPCQSAYIALTFSYQTKVDLVNKRSSNWLLKHGYLAIFIISCNWVNPLSLSLNLNFKPIELNLLFDTLQRA